MLEPIADIVITVFPETLKILLDFSIPVNTKMIEKIFDDLVGDRLGISWSIGKKTCSVNHTRIWEGYDIALELQRIIGLKDNYLLSGRRRKGDEKNSILNNELWN